MVTRPGGGYERAYAHPPFQIICPEIFTQRAMVAAKLANLEHGGNRSKPSIEGLSVEKAADMLNVGRASVELTCH